MTDVLVALVIQVHGKNIVIVDRRLMFSNPESKIMNANLNAKIITHCSQLSHLE